MSAFAVMVPTHATPMAAACRVTCATHLNDQTSVTYVWQLIHTVSM